MPKREYTGVFIELKLVKGNFPTPYGEYVPHLTMLAKWRQSDQESKDTCLRGLKRCAELIDPGTTLVSDHLFLSRYPQWKTGVFFTDVLLGMSKESLSTLNKIRDEVSIISTGEPYKWPFDDSEEVPQHIGVKYGFKSNDEAKVWRDKNWPKDVNLVWEVTQITTACSKLNSS